MVEIGFGDLVRIRDAPETRALGLAGLTGTVQGFTVPSVTGVEAIGEGAEDLAHNVRFEGRDGDFWFAPGLIEFVDSNVGLELRVGEAVAVKTADGWSERRGPR